MKTVWSSLRLGDYCEKIGSGATPRGGESVYQTSGVALIRSQNIYNDRFNYEGLAYIGDGHAAQLQGVTVKEGDVLLNITGDSVARVNYARKSILPARVNQHVAIIRPKSDIFDKKYLYYYLASPYMHEYMLSWASSGGTRGALTKGMIESFMIPRPPIDVQQATARVLGALDDKIELNQQMNHTLEAMAQSLFKSWFLDFDPVTAKAAGRAPFGMNAETAPLFPARFTESELGAIPEGWRTGQVQDLGDVVCGKTPTTKEPDNFGGDIPFITIPDMHNRIVITKTERTLSKKGADTQAKKYLPANSVCVSCIATPGLVCLTTQLSQTNQQINSVIPKISISPYFCYWLLRNLGDEIKAGGSGGTVFHNLNTGDFSKIEVVLPTVKLIEAFHSNCKGIMEMIVENQRQSETLGTMRDLLLPKLLSGEMRVRTAEKMVAEVV